MAYEPNNPNGQAPMADSSPVVIASDQSPLPIDTVGSDLATETTLDAFYNDFFDALDNGPHTVRTNIISNDANLIQEDSTVLATIDSNTFNTYGSVTSIDGKTPALGQATMANSTPVVIASNQTSIPTENRASTDGGGVSAISTSAVATNLVVKASAGALYSLTGINTQGGVRYVQVFDATSLPANSTVPAISIRVPANASFAYSADGGFGRPFSTGIVVATSTTADTLTVSAATLFVDAIYK